MDFLLNLEGKCGALSHQLGSVSFRLILMLDAIIVITDGLCCLNFKKTKKKTKYWETACDLQLISWRNRAVESL